MSQISYYSISSVSCICSDGFYSHSKSPHSFHSDNIHIIYHLLRGAFIIIISWLFKLICTENAFLFHYYFLYWHIYSPPWKSYNHTNICINAVVVLHTNMNQPYLNNGAPVQCFTWTLFICVCRLFTQIDFSKLNYCHISSTYGVIQSTLFCLWENVPDSVCVWWSCSDIKVHVM